MEDVGEVGSLEICHGGDEVRSFKREVLFSMFGTTTTVPSLIIGRPDLVKSGRLIEEVEAMKNVCTGVWSGTRTVMEGSE